MFTTGRIAFIIFFVLAFVGMLIWAYRKDGALHKIHFRRSYKVLLSLIGFILLMFLIVKIRKWL
ncbi:MAG: hypothetical protein EBU33_03720 [Sphingobacteriia bacterium]|nr:hypothetical protein [Sphingobacteriia bacterium]